MRSLRRLLALLSVVVPGCTGLGCTSPAPEPPPSFEVLQLEDHHDFGYAAVVRLEAGGAGCFRVHREEAEPDVWQMGTFELASAEWSKLVGSLRKARPAALAVPAFPPRDIADLGETRLSVRADGRWREYRSQPLSAAVGAVVSRIWQQLDSWAPPPGSEGTWTRPYRVGERSILEPGRRLPTGRRARCVPDGWERNSDP